MLHNTPGRYSNYLFLGFSSEKGFEKKKVWNLGLIAIYPAIDTCSSWDIGSWILHLRP